MSVSTPTGSGNAVTSVTIANGKDITVTKGNMAEAYNDNTSCVQYSVQADKLNSQCLDSSLYYKTESNGTTSNKLGISFGAVSSDNKTRAVTGCDVQNAIDRALEDVAGGVIGGGYIYYCTYNPDATPPSQSGRPQPTFIGSTPALIFYQYTTVNKNQGAGSADYDWISCPGVIVKI